MKISEAFPSNFLKAEDLNGRTVKAVIAGIELQDVGGKDDPKDNKPVLSFKGKSKGLVLNKTNASILGKALGDETSDWIGKEIELISSETQFQGRLVPCIRVRASNVSEGDFNDDINF